MISDIQYKLDFNTLHKMEKDKTIRMNNIARVKTRSTKPLFVGKCPVNSVTDYIILIDKTTNKTVTARKIL